MHLSIIGGGRAAWAFGVSWKRAGWPIDGVALRDGSPSALPGLLAVPRIGPGDDLRSDVVLVAVPDDALPAVCEAVLRRAAEPSWLVHPSGSHDSTLFAGHARAFSLHPLLALPAVGDDHGLEGSLLVFEGTDPAQSVARAIADRLGTRFATVPRETKPLYHAAAVIAANLVAAQLDVAAALMQSARLEVPDVRNAIAGLSRSAVLNWCEREGAARFTGPIARGDVELVRRHLKQLQGHADALRIYRAAGLTLCNALLETRAEDASLREIARLLAPSDLP